MPQSEHSEECPKRASEACLSTLPKFWKAPIIRALPSEPQGGKARRATVHMGICRLHISIILHSLLTGLKAQCVCHTRYGASKWAVEILLRDLHDDHGIPVSIFRCGMILSHSRCTLQAPPHHL